MNRKVKKTIAFIFLIFCSQIDAFSQNIGHISGKLTLNDSWERKIYLSYIKTFDREYAVSNDLILTSAVIDSLGNFKIDLDKIPTKWSFLRLHIVKKGISPNSLVIGSADENFILLVAKQDSKIKLFNTKGLPVFSNTRIEGADYMKTFDHIRKLSKYPNSIDYKSSIIEKEFIKDVVSEKLKIVADTSNNPLVSLYAVYQIDFQSDYNKDTKFYKNFLRKWENESSSYFNSFRKVVPNHEYPFTSKNTNMYFIFLVSIISFFSIVFLMYLRRKNQNIKKLSIQERKIFNLIREGLSNKEISAECNIELTTVKSHISSIYSKLKIRSRKEAINLKIKS